MVAYRIKSKIKDLADFRKTSKDKVPELPCVFTGVQVCNLDKNQLGVPLYLIYK